MRADLAAEYHRRPTLWLIAGAEGVGKTTFAKARIGFGAMTHRTTCVLDALAKGMTEPEVLAAFPFLKPEDIRVALAHQAASQRLLALRGKMKFALSWEELAGKNDD